MTAKPFNTGWTYRQPLGRSPQLRAMPATPTPVTLPHDALRDADRSPDVPGKGAGAYYPPGAYTYLKTFDVPDEWAGRAVRLEFQGAFRHAMVFVNDEFAGNRADGYARFFVDLTPYLKLRRAPTTIRVEVRSGQDSRWYSGCGLHRPVVLHVDEPVHIVPDGVAGHHPATSSDDQAVVEVATRVANLTLSTRTVRRRADPVTGRRQRVDVDETPVTLAPGETALVRQRLYVPDPPLWSVDTPHLYAAASASSRRRCGDGSTIEVRPRSAIRTVTVDPRRGLRINGEPVLLRGACIHHDNGPSGAAAIGRAEERRIELLKAAGFNAIRAAHNPLVGRMLDACDRLGMLVMDEAFDMWTRGKPTHDYAAGLPAVVGRRPRGDGRQGLQPPQRDHVLDRQRDRRDRHAARGAAGPGGWPSTSASLDPTRLVTNGMNAVPRGLDEVAADDRRATAPAG